MKKYEYVSYGYAQNELKERDQMLREMGEEGWELKGIVPVTNSDGGINSCNYLFQREVEPAPQPQK